MVDADRRSVEREDVELQSRCKVGMFAPACCSGVERTLRRGCGSTVAATRLSRAEDSVKIENQ